MEQPGTGSGIGENDWTLADVACSAITGGTQWMVTPSSPATRSWDLRPGPRRLFGPVDYVSPSEVGAVAGRTLWLRIRWTWSIEPRH